MRRCASYALLALLAGFQTASAEPMLAVDIVFMDGDGEPAWGDHFDDGILEEPNWFVVTGDPTESGTTLNLNDGDFVIHPQTFAEETDVMVAGLMTANLPPDVFGFFFLMSTPTDFIALGIFGNGVFVTDETLTGLGVNDYGGGDIAFKIFANAADSTVIVEVNETVIYEGANDMGQIRGIGFMVIPEPSMLALVGSSALLGMRRRRRA